MSNTTNQALKGLTEAITRDREEAQSRVWIAVAELANEDTAEAFAADPGRARALDQDLQQSGLTLKDFEELVEKLQRLRSLAEPTDDPAVEARQRHTEALKAQRSATAKVAAVEQALAAAKAAQSRSSIAVAEALSGLNAAAQSKHDRIERARELHRELAKAGAPGELLPERPQHKVEVEEKVPHRVIRECVVDNVLRKPGQVVLVPPSKAGRAVRRLEEGESTENEVPVFRVRVTRTFMDGDTGRAVGDVYEVRGAKPTHPCLQIVGDDVPLGRGNGTRPQPARRAERPLPQQQLTRPAEGM